MPRRVAHARRPLGYNRGVARRSLGPTRDGSTSGREPSSGTSWAFEDPQQHWADHDERQVRYWRSRPPAERLAQAERYRFRRHGHLPEPAVWTWRFLPPGEH
jgi:hypothetical protein